MTLLNMVLLQWEDMSQLYQNPQAKRIPCKTQLILINMLALEGKVPTFVTVYVVISSNFWFQAILLKLFLSFTTHVWNSFVISFIQDCDWNRRTGLFSSSLEFLLPGGETCFYIINFLFFLSQYVHHRHLPYHKVLSKYLSVRIILWEVCKKSLTDMLLACNKLYHLLTFLSLYITLLRP